MKLLSIAIPCYNSQDYMAHCIESLLPGGEDVEILIVNDGSKDDTAKIADEYAAKYPTIVKAIHKENGGHGSAVNTGIENATGIYFKVVDSDDWVKEDAYLAILEKLKDGEVARSPGMKYKHYAPKADVTILKGSFDAYRDYIAAHAGDGVWALCFDGEEAQLPVPAISYGKEGDGISEAHNLFTVLRELDRKGAKTVYARCPLSDGVSMAVYNRLIRAAAFRVVEV